MGQTAFLFPGQGSQRVGMGQSLCEAYPEVRSRYFERANEILGFDLTDLLFNGPEEELVKTENQQPGIFLVSVAIDSVFREKGVQPAAAAGHSLGEYSALVAAGSLDFEAGLRLTRRRGELMAQVAAETGGIMAAVLGLPAEDVERICAAASDEGVVEVANFNSPTQTVISGQVPAVRRAMGLAREAGARKVVELPVSAPFHCSLMAPLAREFASALDAADIRAPRIPIVANVDAEFEDTAGAVRRNLILQLDSPVRWTASIQQLIEAGIDTFIEVGPGKVLTGLMRQIALEVAAYSTSDPAGIEKVINSVDRK